MEQKIPEAFWCVYMHRRGGTLVERARPFDDNEFLTKKFAESVHSEAS